MPASSLVKYANKRSERTMRGDPLHWGRVDIDGFPFRGQQPPMLREEEYQERVVRAADARNAFFDVSDDTQNRAYLNVMDKAANGLFQIIFIKRFINDEPRHYVEWLEFYMRDGVTRTPYVRNSVMELERGQAASNPAPGLNSDEAG